MEPLVFRFEPIYFKSWLPKADSPAVVVQNTSASVRDICSALSCKLALSSGAMCVCLCWPQHSKSRNTLELFVLPALALAICIMASKNPLVWLQMSSLGLHDLSFAERSSLSVACLQIQTFWWVALGPVVSRLCCSMLRWDIWKVMCQFFCATDLC